MKLSLGKPLYSASVTRAGNTAHPSTNLPPSWWKKTKGPTLTSNITSLDLVGLGNLKYASENAES